MSRRNKKKMKYKGFYCTEELWNETHKIADILDESDSEYVRRAIVERNEKYPQSEVGTITDGEK